MESTDQPLDPRWVRIGQRIFEMRRLHEMTQTRLAEQCYVTQSAVSAWERGVKCPAAPTQHRLADVLHVSRSMLFAELNDPAPAEVA